MWWKGRLMDGLRESVQAECKCENVSRRKKKMQSKWGSIERRISYSLGSLTTSASVGWGAWHANFPASSATDTLEPFCNTSAFNKCMLDKCSNSCWNGKKRKLYFVFWFMHVCVLRGGDVFCTSCTKTEIISELIPFESSTKALKSENGRKACFITEPESSWY